MQKPSFLGNELNQTDRDNTVYRSDEMQLDTRKIRLLPPHFHVYALLYLSQPFGGMLCKRRLELFQIELN